MDETARLASLLGLQILDTAPEEAFDRLTGLAAQAIGMPMACIALVDATRIWRKSVFGMAFIESARDSSFCATAIMGDDVLVVRDVDQRFIASPAVTVLGARCYAGAPIRLANGAAVGTICVLDTVPRSDLGGKDVALLQGLAAAVANLFDLRRELLERQAEKFAIAAHTRLLELAEEMAGLGTWRLDLESRAVQLSPAALAIYGLRDDAAPPDFGLLFSAYDPVDQARILAMIETARRGGVGDGATNDYRLRRFDDGVAHDVRVKSRLERTSNGRSLALVGVVQDVTAEKQALALLAEQGRASDAQALAMHRLAHTDPLTGLPNRRAFVEATALALAGGNAVSLVLIDLDRFKTINDRHGHDVGDQVLESFGRLCALAAGPGCAIGRVGGEEFGLLLCDEAAGEGAAMIAALRQMVIAHPFALPGGASLALTFSAGVTGARLGDDWQSLYSRADAALYAAKHKGRDRTVVSSDLAA